MADLKTEGRIDRVRGRLRSTWGDLTDDDIDKNRGDLEGLIGRIKEKSGETADAIREKLDGFFTDDDPDYRSEYRPRA
jgi:uncharacterized protein YjbJ (UPF0337 family)